METIKKKLNFKERFEACHFQHSAHPSVVASFGMKKEIAKRLEEHYEQMPIVNEEESRTVDTVEIPLSTVSLGTNFDAVIGLRFQGQQGNGMTAMIVDSGNTVLIVPRYEDIEDLPAYTVLATNKREPWGCPANIVQGPICIGTLAGTTYTIEDCIFYACTGDNDDGNRTANFGVGRIMPWNTTSGDQVGSTITLKSPLAFDSALPYAAFDYVPEGEMFGDGLTVSYSVLRLQSTEPADFSWYYALQNYPWMSLMPFNLTIEETLTGWPGPGNNVAFIDTGGGPMFLSDPNGYIYNKSWPEPTACPTWTSENTPQCCLADAVTLNLGDLASKNGTYPSYTFTIAPNTLPASSQGLTLIASKKNSFMQNQAGMNIGGISFLFNDLVIDYRDQYARLGLRPKS